MLHLHIWRCRADVDSCRPVFEELTWVGGKYLEWRKTVIANKGPSPLFVQANTSLKEDGTVSLKEYEASAIGMIQSWADRRV